MPSAYTLAKDQIEQARAILANEVWYDPEVDNLFELALFRLRELEASLGDLPHDHVRPVAPSPLQGPARLRLMPWLES